MYLGGSAGTRKVLWYQRFRKSTWTSCAAQNTLAKLCLTEHVNPKLGLQKCRRDMVVSFYLKPSSSFVFLTMPWNALRPSRDKPVDCILFLKTTTWSKTLSLNRVTMNTARTELFKNFSIFHYRRFNFIERKVLVLNWVQSPDSHQRDLTSTIYRSMSYF